MDTFRSVWKTTWRSLVVALGYIAGLLLGGLAGGMLGWEMPASAGSPVSFAWLVIAAVFLGVFLGRPASRLTLTRRQHLILWGSLIFFNLGSVAIEGAYFAPDLVPVPIPVLFAQQVLASAGAALAIVLLFASVGRSASWLDALRTRRWYSWGWRFLASTLSYLLFYFVFGALNYSLVTKPYYDAHAGGLTAPAPEVVLMIEPVRGLLIVLSVLLFLLSARGTRRQLIGRTGWLLFAIGGLVPLILQLGSLPLFLLVASAIEIFFQNFLTGAVAAWLMGIERRAEGPAGLEQKGESSGDEKSSSSKTGRITMKNRSVLKWLVPPIFLLALFAAGTGLFYQTPGRPYAYTNHRGETVMINGRGLYYYDTVSYAIQTQANDLIALIVGLPLLAVSTWLAFRGSLRGRLLLAGTLGFVLYTYLSMSMLSAYNSLFLVYVTLFALSLYAFILSMLSFDLADLPRRFSPRLPRGWIAAVLFAIGGFLFLAWMGRIVPPLVQNATPPLENTTTLVIQAMDLALIVPAAILAGLLLLRRSAWGYLLASVAVLKGLTLSLAVSAMGISMALNGVPDSPVLLAVFLTLTVLNLVVAVVLLKNVEDRLEAPRPASQAAG